MFHSLPTQFLYSAYQLEATFLDAAQMEQRQYGTCFFVYALEKLLLVTNRHCLQPGSIDPNYQLWQLIRLQVRGYFENEGYVICGIGSVGRTRLFVPSNPEEDVAIIDISTVRLGTKEKGGELIPFHVNAEDVATEEELKGDLMICDMVAFPGYPSWFDRNGNRPIMRTGTIASDPASDYIGNSQQGPARRMAYEAFSFGGSSGSPVFVLEKGFRTSGGIRGGYFRRVMLIGINAGHLTYDTASGPQHSGISFLYKASIINELIQQV